MILVEVGEFVVHEDGRLQFCGDVKFDNALLALCDVRLIIVAEESVSWWVVLCAGV